MLVAIIFIPERPADQEYVARISRATNQYVARDLDVPSRVEKLDRGPLVIVTLVESMIPRDRGSFPSQYVPRDDPRAPVIGRPVVLGNTSCTEV